MTSLTTMRLMSLLVIVALVCACGGECGPAAPPGPDEAPEVEVPSWARVAPEQIAEAKKHGVPVAFENDLGMRFVLIPAGTFLMGSPPDEEGRDWDEVRQTVRISRPFYVQTTEVTNAGFRRWKPDHDSDLTPWKHSLNGDTQPVHARWRDVVQFTTWVSAQDPSRIYRLPTEAEPERRQPGRYAQRSRRVHHDSTRGLVPAQPLGAVRHARQHGRVVRGLVRRDAVARERRNAGRGGSHRPGYRGHPSRTQFLLSRRATLPTLRQPRRPRFRRCRGCGRHPSRVAAPGAGRVGDGHGAAEEGQTPPHVGRPLRASGLAVLMACLPIWDDVAPYRVLLLVLAVCTFAVLQALDWRRMRTDRQDRRERWGLRR